MQFRPLLLDILWPALVLTGVEHARIVPGTTVMSPFALDDMPWSHSLAMSAIWGALLGAVLAWRGAARRAAFLMVPLVMSHWVLDWITHAPDMPLWPGGPEFGLRLWDHVAVTIAVETAMFAGGGALYWRATRARDRTGTVAPAAMIGLLFALYLASAFAPPPPSITPVVVSGLALTVVILAWAAWIERHREARA